MSLNQGEQVCFRILPDLFRYTATIKTAGENAVSIRLHADAPAAVLRGQYLMLTEQDTDAEHCCEVVAIDGSDVRLKCMWTGKRGFFRVDDAFPVLHRKIAQGATGSGSRTFPIADASAAGGHEPDDSVSPRLWALLQDINAKLSLVLERLDLEHEGMTNAENVPVNISASGIRMTLPYRVEIDEVLELKMLLPSSPPVGVIVHGTVVRVEKLETNEFSASLNFEDISDDVRDSIIQYTLKRQRDIIRRQRDLEEES
jgi:hypothetical protein